MSFWFGSPDPKISGKPQQFWFNSTPEIDKKMKRQFGKFWEQANSGALDGLAETPEGTLTLILLCDQFPRNMFRGTKKAFSSDAKALQLAKMAVSRGVDQALPKLMRVFIYLPFEHSEDLNDQDQSVALFEKLGDPSYLKYAVEHREVIKQFGRFPTRNVALGRTSTSQEIQFLNKSNSAR
jgi:uncharacterized protein (DUF924 family)